MASARSSRQRRAALAFAGALLGATFLHATDAPAGVEEQRRRLPPPVTCKDPVEGVWLSLKYDVPLRQWYEYTLEIHREADGKRLKGEVLARFWDGTPTQEKAPACTPGLMHVTVAQPAIGTLRASDNYVEFGGTRWSLKQNHCPPGRGLNYNTDHFSGKIDPAIQEFQSINNDGGVAVNDPTVLRRIRCFDEPGGASPTQPHVDITPPPLRPPQKGTRGCFGSP